MLSYTRFYMLVTYRRQDSMTHCVVWILMDLWHKLPVTICPAACRTSG